MTLEMGIVLTVLAAGLLLFVTEVVRVDVAAVSMVLVLIFCGVLEPAVAFKGFGSPILGFLAGLFVMSCGLVKTGVVERVTMLLRASVRKAPQRLGPACVATVAGVSAFVSNTVTVSLFVPVVASLSRRGGIRPGRLLMPMAYASMLGGVCTVIGTSTNVVVSGELSRLGYEPYSMFTTAKVGLPILLVGMAYVLFIAPRLLGRRAEGDVVDEYSMRSYLGEVIVAPGASWTGKTLRSLRLGEVGIQVLGRVGAGGGELRMMAPGESFEEEDIVLIKGTSQDMMSLTHNTGLKTVAEKRLSQSADLVLVETMVAPGSTLVGHTLKEARFRQRFGAAAIAVYRHGAALHQKLGRVRLHVGDILLVQGQRASMDVLAADDDIIILDDVSHHRARPRRGVVAVLIFLGFVLGGMLTGELGVAALSGAVAMILGGCLTAEEAYDGTDWRLLVLVGSMLSVAHAMRETKAADFLANGIVTGLGDAGPRTLLAVFFVFTIVLTQAMSNQAAALLIVGVAEKAALGAGMSFMPLAVTVTIAASCAFLTPLEPVNILVFGPGRYRFRDFAIVGAPLTFLVFLMTMALVPVFWPL